MEMHCNLIEIAVQRHCHLSWLRLAPRMVALIAFSILRPLVSKAVVVVRPRSLCKRSPTMAACASYEKLSILCQDISLLSSVSEILDWDEQVMMPSAAAASRGKQKAALTSILHEKSTSDNLRDAIEEAKGDFAALNEFEQANVRDAERNYRLAVGVPADLAKQIAELEVIAIQTWTEARSADDFASFLPLLKKTLDLARQKATAMRPGEDPYDTLIDYYERGMSSKRIGEIFEQIDAPLRQLILKTLDAKDKCSRKVHPALSGGDDWNFEKQVELCNDICKVLGFDFNRGRIDVSAHPFSLGASPDDVRITTRYSKEAPFEGIMCTVHEAGHGLYEQGRNKKYEGLPVSVPLSTGAHESQSLFWERMIAQNIGFWECILPKIHEKLPHTKEASAEDLFFAVNQVNRSLIRVDADELTYPFHIILRFELEKKLLDGSLAVEDIPKAWNDGMKKHLGIDVPSDKDGCLQDIHWAGGGFGYFPTYTLGAMTAAQLFRHLKTKAMLDVNEKISSGSFGEIREWLRKEIHEVGSLYPSLDELLVKVTGEPLNPQHFLDYLEDKYARIYS